MKLVIFMVLAVALAVEGFPASDDNNISSAAMDGQWNEVQRLLNNFYSSKFQLAPLGNDDDVRSLKPQAGGRFYAEAESTFHHHVNDNGKIQEASGGHKIINDNGKVQEWDLHPQKPNFQTS